MITDKDITKMKKVFATKDDLDAFATKDDLKGLAKQKDLDEVKITLGQTQKSVGEIQTNLGQTQKTVGEIKDKLDTLYDFSEKALGNLLSWTDDIHRTIVKKDLPKRVARIEKRFEPLSD